MILTHTIPGAGKSLLVSALLVSTVAVSAIPASADHLPDDVERCEAWLGDQVPPIQLLEDDDNPPDSPTDHCGPWDFIRNVDRACSEFGKEQFDSDAGCDPAQWILDYCEHVDCVGLVPALTINPSYEEPTPVQIEPVEALPILPGIVTVAIALTTGEGFTALDSSQGSCAVWGSLPVVESCAVTGVVVDEPQHMSPEKDLLCVYPTYIGLDVIPGTGDDLWTENAQTVEEC